ncbi:MAG: hydrolase [Clostridia bacterium]|nr:hydrolase [Clostridia bacterium]MDD4146499.1 hydrolase [Clostridia bacterium]MDD4666012.1 hydrolase [Clostridia bacterium]
MYCFLRGGDLLKDFVPEIHGRLRKHMVRVPAGISSVGGIRIFGKLIKSLLFSTDVAIIKNCNADAVIAVYPFTPQPIITQSIINVSGVPVFCGVGGGTTTGKRVVNLAVHAEHQGAMGVVLNAPTKNEIIKELYEKIDIPIIVTVVSEYENFEERLKSGAAILNVSGAAKTPLIVKQIRAKHPEIPIIATGGPNEETIRGTIEAGANAITYTPPTSAEIFKIMMQNYRQQL